MPFWAWSYLLTAVGIIGLLLAGSKRKLGWAIGLGAQVLWVAYAVATEQWGFIISAFAYGSVYLRNWLLWHREIKGIQVLSEHHELNEIPFIRGIGTVRPGQEILHNEQRWLVTDVEWGPDRAPRWVAYHRMQYLQSVTVAPLWPETED